MKKLILLLIAISPVLVAPIGAALVILLADRKDRNRAFVSIIQEREAKHKKEEAKKDVELLLLAAKLNRMKTK